MHIHSFLDKDSETFTHVVIADNNDCAIIDPVLDYDHASGRTDTQSADKVIDLVHDKGLAVKYIIETHAHADHLSSAPYLQAKLGGQIVIGKYIDKVQHTFKGIFNLEWLQTGGSQFDVLTDESTKLTLGNIEITVMHVPGHTPADMAYQFKDDTKTAVFVGDTIFAPDVGTARCDFPNGSASDLYDSIQKLLALPDDTLLYLCHDYPNGGRKHCPVVSVAEQKLHNIHVKDGITKEEFVHMRIARDKTLGMPRLIIPAVQVNINAGELPKAEDNGISYIKVPLNTL